MGGSKLKEENGTSMGMSERRSGEREDEHEREHDHGHDHENEQCPCPSTSDEDDPGLRPSQLYGKFTWKIENFSQISKRELRSNVFEVGGYKWYILVYPQGCDVCNHLSLFLCVADYDKLLPGWSHFAQFTIAVVNKDPKKSKYSDTLHRFCKKEHDWGWKKFMEVSKVLDGFTMADTLVIKAQVQVIRENPHRPFRCLDSQYRRELVRVYITNVEAICRRFVEEKREKLAKLREDTGKWSSFRTFWLAVDEDEQRRMSREKTDVILKQVVKRFFNEKEVTSTLVMDALYSGYKALECQSANNKGKSRSMDLEDISSPVVCVEKDVFVLADDVLSLLERAATEPLPPLKDDKGPQNRTKDGGSGDDFGRDSVDCDEKCLTELGRRTVEMFVLAHLYSNHVEMAYQRDVSIKMQEELIREEEAASHAEIEQRAKREAADKEKRSKKKQAKQRRRTPKEKDRVRNDNGDINAQHQQEILSVIRNVDASSSKESSLPVLEILGTPDEGDLSGMDKTDNVVGIIGPETEDGDVSRVDWDRDSSEMQQDMEASFSGSVSVSVHNARMARKQRHALDDSSSTCSTDSLASVAMNGSYKGNSSNKCESLSTRGKNKSNSERYDTNSGTRAGAGVVVISALDANNNISKSRSNEEVLTLRQQVQWLEQRIVEKDDEISLLKNKLNSYQQQIDCDKPFKQQDMTASHHHTRSAGLSSSRSVDDDDDEHKSSCVQVDSSALKYGSSCTPGELQVKSSSSKDLHTESGKMEGTKVTLKKNSTLSHSVSLKQNMKKTVPPTSRSREIDQSAKSTTTAPIESDEMLRPSSAPLIPSVPRSNIPAVLTPSVPLLARSISAAGRLDSGVDPITSSNLSLSRSPSVSPSYRNAAAGKMKGTSSGHFPPVASSVAHTGVCVTQSPPSSLCTVSSSNSYKAPISCPELLGRIREDASSSSSVCIPSHSSIPQSTMLNGFAKDHTPVGEQSASHMGFTFGTIMPELLHRNRPQELQDVDVTMSGVEDHRQKQRFLEHCVRQQQRKLQNLHVDQFQSEQDNPGLRFRQSCPDDLANQGLFKSMNSRNVIRRTGAVMGEEFPHLDMIDYLLDEEQSRGKVALSTKLQNPGEQILNGQFYLPGFHGPKIDLQNGSGFERYMPEEESTLQMACPSDWCSSGLSESMQVLPPYPHSSPSQYYDQYNGQLEEVSPHNWSMYSADMPQKSFMNNGHGPIASPMGNSIQGHHYSAGHCSNYTLGPNGYAFY